ncbi:MAG: (deoxy)nucleoside triphosphate pyrophosphohydrolase [Alphaproteobacteria bacterium]|nr:(deoxy)nucleoside triphosphate pyrophosphohydrolase [Alphaproteobacteria bacterium]
MKIVGTAIIVDEQKRVLIGQRPEGKALPGLWEFPGGKQEENETIEQCIVREIYEELNIKCVVGDFLMSVSKKYEHGDFKLMVYQVFVNDFSSMQANVHQNLRWISPQEMNPNDFPPADVEIITFLQKNF